MLNKIEEVLISGKKDWDFFGRTRNFKEVYFSGENINIWDIVNVKITELDWFVLKWKIVN